MVAGLFNKAQTTGRTKCKRRTKVGASVIKQEEIDKGLKSHESSSTSKHCNNFHCIKDNAKKSTTNEY